EFLVEQIAGDLLGDDGRPTTADGSRLPSAVRRPSSSPTECLIATGFLAIGPKVISEVDDRKMEMDTIDEQLDTLGRTVMGMTLGCARCHDHKFDPITTQDYYGLAGIFKSTKTMSVMTKPRMWFEHSLATEADRARQATHARQVGAAKEAIAKRVAEATEQLR